MQSLLHRWLVLQAVALTTLLGPPLAQAQGRDQVKADFLFLGSYHMANHGLDGGNIVADDVLAPARQRQIATVVRVIEDYRPTKVMIEVRSEQQADIERDFAASCKGVRALSREEYEQIGFRVACALRHRKVYAVNWDEVKPSKDTNFKAAAERSRQQREYEDFLSDVQALARDDQTVLKAGTVLEMLRHLNSPSWRGRSAALYQRLALFGTEDDPAGANWVQYWFGRNLMIFNKIVRATDAGDRILVIFGAGHGSHLVRFAEDSGIYRVHDVASLNAVSAASKREEHAGRGLAHPEAR